jgi:hypothetical protein
MLCLREPEAVAGEGRVAEQAFAALDGLRRAGAATGRSFQAETPASAAPMAMAIPSSLLEGTMVDPLLIAIALRSPQR